MRLSSSEFPPSRGWPLDFFSALLDFFFLLGSLRPLLVLLGPSSLAAASHRFVDDPKEGEETETEGAPTDDGEATENGDGKREGEGGLDDRSRSMEWKERERRGKGESERSGKAARRQKGAEREREEGGERGRGEQAEAQQRRGRGWSGRCGTDGRRTGGTEIDSLLESQPAGERARGRRPAGDGREAAARCGVSPNFRAIASSSGIIGALGFPQGRCYCLFSTLSLHHLTDRAIGLSK